MSDANQVRIFTWSMAEELAEGHMRHLGFSDARRTPPGVDGGFDVVASSAVAQVKHHAAPVGAPDVQRLRGAAHDGRTPLFYSSSGYTKAALDYAATARVALFSYDTSTAVRASNEAAAALVSLSAGSTRETHVTSTADLGVQAQRLRLKAVQEANELLDEHVDALLDTYPDYSDGEDEGAAYDAFMKGVDLTSASAVIISEWAMQQFEVTHGVAEGNPLSLNDYEALVENELRKRRKLLELFSLSPDEFPITQPI